MEKHECEYVFYFKRLDLHNVALQAISQLLMREGRHGYSSQSEFDATKLQCDALRERVSRSKKNLRAFLEKAGVLDKFIEMQRELNPSKDGGEIRESVIPPWSALCSATEVVVGKVVAESDPRSCFEL